MISKGEVERLASYSNPENGMSLFLVEDSFKNKETENSILSKMKSLKETYGKQMEVISDVILKDRNLILDVLSPIMT